ncbi:Adenosylmethionine-8-amino-7-oxononanoate aminotransferase [Micromonospora phaseoli]|uniref:Adenosylmethionine-8-amino-7-oxononanoate aminotransferase n=1 Tax=Micromonospora phaseoli TaxID=1144548 RepID=A0A1H7CPR0_9ACTN|nr:aminotransferase class III-fold pyridoxal phosphate-dependent enzyme [Micromonospora phaseoli]PZV91658.1 adenosylmethionine-8-amino-7-oxononanoate aminotransferase [Micromonospora phaseoli]GIJ79289.1 aspartate aminotransferase family protein [Micromonospora phaseoli]SEJ91204.1 Adenosylmethionine-8-amino-7-oxononanoate aminotransferase [Micromonospora phaseoli]
MTNSEYAVWHGLTPMGPHLRENGPDLFLVGGSGSHLVDAAGRRYLDARSSMWNVTLGYSCEPVKQAMARQLDVLPSGTVMRYEHPPQVTVDYAAALVAVLPAPLRHVRFGNTGSQMTESAAMLSRFYRRMTGETDRHTVIALHEAYHGTGPLATALTDEPILHDYSAPVDAHVVHVSTPPPETCDPAACTGECVRPVIEAIDAVGAERVTAVMFEPVSGTSFRPAPTHYLETLIVECRRRGIHSIADEVTTGAGRVGAMTYVERLTEVPDMLVLGKGLSAGYFPLAALVVASDIYETLADPPVRLGFPNGSTTDGHPVGAASGLAVLDILTADDFLPGVRRRSAELIEMLATASKSDPRIGTVRGAGMMLGVELRDSDGELWSLRDVSALRGVCREHGLLTSYSIGVLPLLPHLTISTDDCRELVERFAKAVAAYQP